MPTVIRDASPLLKKFAVGDFCFAIPAFALTVGALAPCNRWIRWIPQRAVGRSSGKNTPLLSLAGGRVRWRGQLLGRWAVGHGVRILVEGRPVIRDRAHLHGHDVLLTDALQGARRIEFLWPLLTRCHPPQTYPRARLSLPVPTHPQLVTSAINLAYPQAVLVQMLNSGAGPRL